MGCNCLNEKKSDKAYIKRLAIAFAISEQVNVNLYTFYLTGIGDAYDFEPIWSKEKRQVVEVIQFQDYQSEEVLPDAGDAKSDVDAKEGESTKPSDKKSGTNRKTKASTD